MLNSTVHHTAQSCESKQPETFAAELLHDLRQPLSTIETCVYLLKASLHEENAPSQKYLEMIEEQIEEASRILAAARFHGASPRSATQPQVAALTTAL